MSPRTTVPMLMPNSPAANVGIELGARAGVHTPVSACASGAEAIGYAIEMIRTGRADVVVAGGTEAAIHPLPIAAFGNMMAMSKNNDDPQGASRPYDADRNGFVLGEGAGVIVLESEEHAKARGARVYAEAVGQGISADGHHITQPEPSGNGIAHALQNLLDSTDLKPAEIVHVNAHATSTPQGDVAEIKALRKVFGDDVDTHGDLRDQVDDRSPARWRRRHRDRRVDPGAGEPYGSADDQPGEPRPRGQRGRGDR
ncbi:hypothetical protein GCM10017687_50200 [Streptomyces echinatus]